MCYNRIALFLLASCLTAVACSEVAEPDNAVNSIVDGPEFITVSLGEDTRTGYAFEDGTLKTYWSEGDVVSVVPDLYNYYNAGTYSVVNPGSGTGTFQVQTSVGISADTYGIFFPGDRIKSTSQYTRFSYEGQVQQKSDPMGHLGSYHSMRTSTADYSTISFNGADQSSCMRIRLSGMTFDHPTKIELRIVGKGKFYTNNQVAESFTHFTNDPKCSLISASSLTLDLEGYEEEDYIEAWMMMSNASVQLYAGDILRVHVQCEGGGRYCSDINITGDRSLTGGHCHKVAFRTGWKEDAGDYTEYDWDGEVVTLQKGRDGLDLVIMGDGFIKEDFDNGTYDAIMRQAYAEFFNVEPFTTLKDAFNVFYVKAPSHERIQAVSTGNGAINTGHDTKFSTRFTANSTSVSGDNDLVREYAMKAFDKDADERIMNATIVVMANQVCRAGTCVNSYFPYSGVDYGMANAIAYCSLGRDDAERVELMHHEICGHGFGKLADEYYYNGVSSLSTSLFTDLENFHSLGLFRNVDRYIDSDLYNQTGGMYALTDTSNVYWHSLFNTANRYESSEVESLGIFKGAYTYPFAFCRPTEDANKSIMNSNRGIFNAISRRAIYYRYKRLTGEIDSNIWGTPEEIDTFLKWDAEQILSGMVTTNTVDSDASFGTAVMTDPESMPLAPPVYISGRWENGRFIED